MLQPSEKNIFILHFISGNNFGGNCLNFIFSFSQLYCLIKTQLLIVWSIE